jgi:hypothetical protein
MCFNKPMSSQHHLSIFTKDAKEVIVFLSCAKEVAEFLALVNKQGQV